MSSPRHQHHRKAGGIVTVRMDDSKRKRIEAEATIVGTKTPAEIITTIRKIKIIKTQATVTEIVIVVVATATKTRIKIPTITTKTTT